MPWSETSAMETSDCNSATFPAATPACAFGGV